jgi:hypothetical protein
MPTNYNVELNFAKVKADILGALANANGRVYTFDEDWFVVTDIGNNTDNVAIDISLPGWQNAIDSIAIEIEDEIIKNAPAVTEAVAYGLYDERDETGSKTDGVIYATIKPDSIDSAKAEFKTAWRGV